MASGDDIVLHYEDRYDEEIRLSKDAVSAASRCCEPGSFSTGICPIRRRPFSMSAAAPASTPHT